MTFVSFALLGAMAQANLKADPTDDFSFSFSFAPLIDSFELMPEKQVVHVLQDHLDSYPRTQIPRLARHLIQLCRKYKFDPAFVLSMIEVESRFRVSVVSPAGAIGLMQIMPDTAAKVAKAKGIPYQGSQSLTNPFTNLSIGIAYLDLLRERYRGLSPYFHIAAYNIGPARLDQLRSKKGFRPDKTRQYYQSIRDGVPRLRDYRTRLHTAGKRHPGV